MSLFSKLFRRSGPSSNSAAGERAPEMPTKTPPVGARQAGEPGRLSEGDALPPLADDAGGPARPGGGPLAQPLEASAEPPAPESEGDRLKRQALAYVSGQSGGPPTFDPHAPLHDCLMENLTHLLSAVDWSTGHLRDGQRRQRLASPASQDQFAGISHPDAWTKLMTVTHEMLRHIRPRRRAAVVVCMRDDGLSLVEWIAHHRAIGFDAIFVYTNDNADGSDAMLAALAEQDLITLIDNPIGPGTNPQRKAFSHSLFLLSELRDFEWVFYADSDEFLSPGTRFDHRIENVLTAVDEAHPDASAICYHWRWYTSGNRFAWRREPLLTRFTRAIPHSHIKSLVRLAKVTSMARLHFPEVAAPRVFLAGNLAVIAESTGPDVDAMWKYETPNYEDGWICHYWCKSFEEFLLKQRRGATLGDQTDNAYKRDLDQFFTWNRADQDAQAAPLAPDLLERVATERARLIADPRIGASEVACEAGFRSILQGLGGPAFALSIYLETAARLGLAPQLAPLVIPDHQGTHYQTFMARLHEVMQPANYLEIGPPLGGTLSKARGPSLVIDPECHLNGSVMEGKAECHVYRGNSDAFFDTHDPAKILGAPVDLAFLDGLHMFEALLRDFINVERHAAPDGMIILHDCVPTDLHMARRDLADMRYEALRVHDDWWTGDVWKVPLILKKYRPDLTIVAVDCIPTGAVLITGLDPASTVLRDRFDMLVGEFAGMSLADIGLDGLCATLDLRHANSIFDGAGPARVKPPRADAHQAIDLDASGPKPDTPAADTPAADDPEVLTDAAELAATLPPDPPLAEHDDRRASNMVES